MPVTHSFRKTAYFAATVLFVLAGALFSHNNKAGAFSGGDGTQANPYLIANCSDLSAINSALSAHFRLAQNVTCGQITPLARSWSAPDQWVAAGYHGFTGDLDGNGKTVTFTITGNPDDACQALFCYVEGAIYNLAVTGSVSGASFVGGVAGIAANGSVLSGITSSVTITASPASGEVDHVGGIVGSLCKAAQDCTFNNNAVSGSITVTSPESAGFIGGMAGSVGSTDAADRPFSHNYHSGTITISSVKGGGGVGGLYGIATDLNAVESTNTGSITVTATHPSDGQVFQTAGLFGTGDNVSVTDSYNSGSITGSSAGHLGVGGHSFGGLIGYGTLLEVHRSYNVGAVTVNGTGLVFGGVGGLVGFAPDDTVIAHSFNAGNITSNASSAQVTGAIIGNAPDGITSLAATYFDVTRSLLGVCVGNASPAGCTSVNSGNAQPNYFFNTAGNAPLNNWNFDSIWHIHQAAFPSLLAFASGDSQQATAAKKTPVAIIEPDDETATAQDLDEIVLNDTREFNSADGAQFEDLQLGQVLRFYVPTADSDEEHTITISQIGANFIVVTLASTPFNATLYVGETDEYDVNKDDKDDIALTLRGVSDGLADITFRQLGVDDAKTVNTANHTQASMATRYTLYGLGGVFVIAGGVAIWLRRRHHTGGSKWQPDDPDLR